MFKSASQKKVAESLRALAEYAESNGASRRAVIAGLHRIKMALSQDAKEAVEAMGPLKADSRKEVMDGFKKQNPDLSPAELNEIADQWEKNKNVVKDKQADDDEKQSRHEEGKPADPTKDMSPEDAKKWREMNEKYKDSLKKAMKG